MILSSLPDYSLRALVLAASAGVLVLCLRRRSAAFGHAIWTGVAIAMLLMPLTPLLHSARRTIPTPHFLAPPNAQQIVSVRSAVIHPDDPPRVIAFHDWAKFLDAFYLFGVFALLARIAFGGALTRRALSGARSIRGEPAIRAITLDATTGIEESPAVAVPLTTGILNRRVILPLSWRDWPASKLACVLAHEFAHVERLDTLVVLIAAINVAIFWFHPIAWWIERRVRRLAELAADDAALATSSPADYAAALVEIASLKNGRSLLWSTTSMSGVARIAQRVDRILEDPVAEPVPPVRARLFTATAAMAGILFSSAIAFAPRAAGQNHADGLPYLIGFHSETPASAITSPDAANLEARLAANPEDETTRKALLTYYDQQHLAAQQNAATLWLIQHHPESDLLASGLTSINPRTDPDAASQADALFRAQVEAHPNDTRVLLNAARRFSGSERVKLIEQAVSLDPSLKPGLAFEYGSVIFADATHDPNWHDSVGGSDGINYVKAQIAASNDPKLLGLVAYRLVEASVGETSPAFDYAGVRSLAIDLLARAEVLEPKNTEWPNYMEGAVRLLMSPSAQSRAATNPAPPKIIRVGGNVQKANLTYAPAPPAQPVHGTVDLRIRIDETGHVIETKLISGPEALTDTALSLARQYVYRPTLLNGVPVSVITTVAIDF